MQTDYRRHNSAVRLIFVSLALVIAGCGDSNADRNALPPPSGWEYRPQRGAYEARVTYIDDARDAGFVGMCEGAPTYILKGGDYQSNAPQFTLTVDDKSWTLPITYHAHGRMLVVDRYEQQLAIAKATRRIVFRIGSWRSEIKPGPELASFVKDCD